MSLDCIDCHPEIHTDCSTPKTRKQHWRCVTHQKEPHMLYIVKATPDEGVSFWHVIHAPQLPSWTEDREGHVAWWDKHVKPIVGDNVELEITTFANEDYTISTEDIEAIGVEWSFSDYPD